MVTPVKRAGPLFSLCIALGAGCGGAPEPAASPRARETAATVSEAPAGVAPARSRAEAPEACEQQPGKPPPEPLERAYTGVAAKARCQNEVYAIMGHVAEDLGVTCSYCHADSDFRAMTPRKQVANWMASALVPALREHDGGTPWCNDCHTLNGRGVAKILGEPRNETFAAEWMTTHLVEDFETASGDALHCKSCHRGSLGTPEFQRKIILTNNLPHAR